MDTTELKSVLGDADLSPYQIEAYVTVLECGAAPATEIAERSDVPGPRIYDVLRALEERGYIETHEQDMLRAIAHSPEDVLSDLQERADRFERAAREIEERWEQPTLDSHAVSIVGSFETVLNRVREFIRDAESQIQLSATPTQFDALEPVLREAYENGVSIRISVNTGPDEGIDSLPAESAFVGACTEARHRPMPSPFFATIDLTRVCFAPHVDSANQLGCSSMTVHMPACFTGIFCPVSGRFSIQSTRRAQHHPRSTTLTSDSASVTSNRSSLRKPM